MIKRNNRRRHLMILALLMLIQILAVVPAVCETWFRPVRVLETFGAKPLTAFAFVTPSAYNNSLSVDVFMVVENITGIDKEFKDGIVAYGTVDGVLGSFTLFAREPEAISSEEFVLYTGSAPIDLPEDVKQSDVAFVAAYEIGSAEDGKKLVDAQEIEIKDATTPGTKKMVYQAKGIPRDRYSVMFLAFADDGTLVFADRELMGTKDIEVDCWIEDREAAAIEAAGYRLSRAFAFVYPRE